MVRDPSAGNEPTDTVEGRPDGSLTPDELEQHQDPHGALSVAGALDDVGADEPLSADMLEQRRAVETDDEDDPRDR